MRPFLHKFILLALVFALEAKAQSIFIPENGSYDYNLSEITAQFEDKGLDYLQLKSNPYNSNLKYKLDKKRNEFQIKDWFERDWYQLQEMFAFDVPLYIESHRGIDFNSAKRNQYSGFSFDKKKFYHRKSTPAMKEWGGLTHPPLRKLSLPLVKYDRNFYAKDYTKTTSPYFSPQLQMEIDQVSKSELTFKNIVVPLADRAVFFRKKSLIAGAQKSILMSSLVFVCDKGTTQIVDLLIRKHQAGVDVKIIADGMISKILKHRACLEKMSKAGIDVIETKDFFRHKLKAIYHTKTLVVDLKEAIAGGHNMIDADNLSRGTDFKNRDVDIYVRGPMVTDIVKQFVENWNYQTTLNDKFSPLSYYASVVRGKLLAERKAGLRGKDFYSGILGNVSTRMKGVCRFIKQAPYEDRHTIGKAYLKLLDHVNRHLVISDPVKVDTYVGRSLKDAPLLDKLDNFEMFNLLHRKVQSLAKKGKMIDYITTNITMAGNENTAIMNERIADQLKRGKDLWANWSFAKLVFSNSYYGKPHYKNLMKDWLPFKNVHIWKHISFMHSKIFYFDRVVASIGSYNFQHNATDQAYESTAICMDENLNRELDRILVEDMANSIPFIYSELR